MAPKLRLAHLKQEEPRLSSKIKYANAGFEHEPAQDGEIAADLAAWRAEPKAQGAGLRVLRKSRSWRMKQPQLMAKPTL